MSAVWFELTVEVPAKYSDAVANFLIENGAPGLQLDERGDVVCLVAHYGGAPPLASLRRFCADIGARLDRDVGIREVAEENWAEDWKLHFQPQLVGDRFYVCPPWDSAAPSNRVSIVIEPGRAFGTGQHATTRGCLCALDWAVGAHAIRRAVDVGTGSGILAIALAKLGVPEVWAVDVDAQALVIAAENATRNGVASQIRMTSEIGASIGPANIVVANLFANLLLDLAAKLARQVAPRGILICSGFVSDDARAVQGAYEALGFSIANRYEEGGWVTLVLRQSTEP